MNLKLTSIIGILAGLALSTSTFASITINYTSPYLEAGKTSTGADLDDSFHFSLGVFQSGFTPSSDNMAEWAANFTAIPLIDESTDNWNAEPDGKGEYSAIASLGSNDPPFLIGSQAYVWGYNTTEVGSTAEWILIANPSWWIIGDASENPPSFNWSTDNVGTITVDHIGSLGESGVSANPYIQTMAVPEPNIMALIGLGLAGLLINRKRRRPCAW